MIHPPMGFFSNVLLFARAGNGRDRDELAFLPAALEIVETPPSPVGRTLGFTIIAMFCIALAWACLGGLATRMLQRGGARMGFNFLMGLLLVASATQLLFR